MLNIVQQRCTKRNSVGDFRDTMMKSPVIVHVIMLRQMHADFPSYRWMNSGGADRFWAVCLQSGPLWAWVSLGSPR